MTLVSNPNGLLIASALFALGGLAILSRALFEAYASSAPTNGTAQPSGQTKVALMFGLPLLAIGMFLNGAGQVATGPIGPGITCMLLALAFILLMYAMLEGQFGDEVAASQRRAAAPDTTRRLQGPPPKLIAVEARDDAETASEAARQALPA